MLVLPFASGLCCGLSAAGCCASFLSFADSPGCLSPLLSADFSSVDCAAVSPFAVAASSTKQSFSTLSFNSASFSSSFSIALSVFAILCSLMNGLKRLAAIVIISPSPSMASIASFAADSLSISSRFSMYLSTVMPSFVLAFSTRVSKAT